MSLCAASIDRWSHNHAMPPVHFHPLNVPTIPRHVHNIPCSRLDHNLAQPPIQKIQPPCCSSVRSDIPDTALRPSKLPPSELPKPTFNHAEKVGLERPKRNPCPRSIGDFQEGHELQRPLSTVHQRNISIRKCWILVDASKSGTMLSNCRDCTYGKKYEIAIEAVKHLFDFHFRPYWQSLGERADEATDELFHADFLRNSSWIKEVEDQIVDEKVILVPNTASDRNSLQNFTERTGSMIPQTRKCSPMLFAASPAGDSRHVSSPECYPPSPCCVNAPPWLSSIRQSDTSVSLPSSTSPLPSITAPSSSNESSSPISKTTRVPTTPLAGKKRKQIEGECPICYVEFIPDKDELVYCKSSCGNNFHKSCFSEWENTFQQRRKVTCPFCCSKWENDNSDEISKKRCVTREFRPIDPPRIKYAITRHTEIIETTTFTPVDSDQF